jgi:hypothetical protein
MNIVLLAKWQIRFQNTQVIEKWKDIILAKYSPHSVKYSPFWKAILKDKDLVELGFNKLVGSGTIVSFWTDRWYQECVLFVSYPLLYSIADKPNITVADAYADGHLHLLFKK